MSDVNNAVLIDTRGKCIKKNLVTGRLQGNKAYHIGYRDHQNGRPASHPENIDYMMGYNDFEPLIVTRRVGNKRPKYSVADVDYQTNLTGLPEWFNSPSDALYYARAVDAPSRLGFGWRITEYHQKNETFEQKVSEDSLIKPDVSRLYQSTITGCLSTSIDGGKTWFDGGIMDYPLMPKVEIRELCGGGYHAVSVGWDYDYHYVTRTRPRLDELKKGSFKLKPAKPLPPIFDAHPDRNDEWLWWQWHMKTNFDCRNSYAHYDYSEKEEDQLGDGDKPKRHTRCGCYREKVAEYEKAVKKYELAMKKWLES